MFSVSARASGPFSECSVVPGPDAATPLCCQYFPMESEFHAVSPLLSLRVTCSATAASDPSRTSPATMIGIRRNTTFPSLTGRSFHKNQHLLLKPIQPVRRSVVQRKHTADQVALLHKSQPQARGKGKDNTYPPNLSEFDRAGHCWNKKYAGIFDHDSKDNIK